MLLVEPARCMQRIQRAQQEGPISCKYATAVFSENHERGFERVSKPILASQQPSCAKCAATSQRSVDESRAEFQQLLWKRNGNMICVEPRSIIVIGY